MSKNQNTKKAVANKEGTIVYRSRIRKSHFSRMHGRSTAQHSRQVTYGKGQQRVRHKPGRMEGGKLERRGRGGGVLILCMVVVV